MAGKKGQKRGPSFNRKVGKFILDKLIEGMTLKEICHRFADKVPGDKTIIRWKVKYPEFGQAYEEARRIQAEGCLEDMREIAETIIDENLPATQANILIRENDRRFRQKSHLLGVLNREKYGNKVNVEHSGNSKQEVVVVSYAAEDESTVRLTKEQAMEIVAKKNIQ